MDFSGIDSLKRAFKFPVLVLALLTFSTSASPSGKFIFYRFLVFSTFSIIVLYRVSLLFNREAENDRQLQQQQEVLQTESVLEVVDWVFAFAVTVFLAYQVFKKKSLKVFELAAKVDKLFTTVYGLKIDYKKTFLMNFIVFGLVLTFFTIFSVVTNRRGLGLIIFIYDVFTSCIGTLLFLVLMFVISICLEVRWRLKLLGKITNGKATVLSYSNSSRETDNLLAITQMLSEAIQNLSDFFGMEILIIFGRFCLNSTGFRAFT